MVQAGKNLRLTLEPCETIRIGRKRLGQDLQRHLAVQLGIGGLLDLAHPALTDEGGHVVMREAGADFERHGVSGLVAAILCPSGQWLHQRAGYCLDKAYARIL